MAETSGNNPDSVRDGADDSEQVSLIDLLAIVARRKRVVLGLTAGVALSTLALLMLFAVIPAKSRWNLLPPVYQPTARVLVQDNSSNSGVSSLLNQSGLSSLSGLLGASSLSSKYSSADLAQYLLKSRTIEDAIAQQFDFIARYHLTRYPKTSARDRFEHSLKLKFNEKSAVLEISYQDVDAEFATEVVNAVTERLQDQFADLTMGKVVAKRKYLEKAIANQQQEADRAADRLSTFQNKHGVYDLSAQTQANISALASLQAQLTGRQTDLELQSKYIPETDARLVMLRDQIAQLRKQINELKTGARGQAMGDVSLSQMVNLASEYASLKSDIQVQQTILLTLKQQYEAARLEEQDTSPTFQIIEKAEVPEVRASPRRTRIMILATAVAFFCGLLLAFAVEYFERAKRVPTQAEKLSTIAGALSFRRRRSN